jgi:hypothetical protein
VEHHSTKYQAGDLPDPAASTASTHVLLAVPAAKAVSAEAWLSGAGVPCRLVPTPRSVSSRCGVSLRVALADRNTAERVLAFGGFEVEAAHEIELPSRAKKGSG